MPTTTGKASELITFSRTSNATLVDSDGRIKWAPHNLLLASEQFDAASWTKTNLLAFGSGSTANTISAPNGTTTADLLTPNTTNASHRTVGQTLPVTTSMTFACFVKANGYTKVGIRESDASGAGAAFNLSGSGSVIGVYDTAGGTVTEPSITPLASNWFLISCKVSFASNTQMSCGIYILSPSYASGDLQVSWAPNGTDGIYVWGAHAYRSDLGGMKANTSAYPMYNPTTPKNLLGFSEDFSNAGWTKANIAAFGSGSVSNAILAPNGLQTADKIVASNSASATRAIYQNFTPVSGSTYVVSVYAKSAEYSKLALQEIAAGRFGATFDLTAQTSTSLGGGGYVSSSITPVSDGWFRCSVTWTGSGAAAVTMIGYPAGATVSASGTSYAGDGTSGIYLWGAQLSDSASLDTYVPNYGAAPTAAAYYGPRLDFDGETLAAKGLLVEELRANLLLHSAAFDNVAWSKSAGATISAIASTSPDGTSNADKLVFGSGAASGTAYLYYAVSGLTNAISYTQSVFIKEAGVTTANIWSNISGSYKSVRINLLTGALSQNGGQALPTTYSAVNAGSGWWRVIISETTSGTSGNVIYVDTSVTGDGTNGVLLYGAQLEAGSFATSYIPVGATSAGATRNADVASVSTQAFPYSSTEGTWVANFQTIFDTTNPVASSILTADGSASKLISYIGGGGNQVSSYDGATIITRAIDVTGPVSKAASAYNASGRALAVNGSAVATGTIAAGYSTVSTANLGGTVGTGPLNGWLRQITYLPRRISDAELTTRST